MILTLHTETTIDSCHNLEGYDELIKKHQVNHLKSYWYIKNRIDKEVKERSEYSTLILDSGAFSAFTQNVTIDIDQYCKDCLKLNYTYYMVLDVIGNAEETLQNQKYMEKKGIKPIPCFHYGDNWKYLDYYCEKYDYVALGGMVPITSSKLLRWLDMVFTKYPKQKFHGLGLTTQKLVHRYPWFSVDSSSWLSGARAGTLYDNKLGNKHYSSLTKLWEMKIKERGFTIKEMKENYRKRTEFNIYSYLEMQKEHKTTEFKIRQSQLCSFGVQEQTDHKETIQQTHMQWLKKHYGDITEELGKRLVAHEFDIPIEQVKLC